jgi:hypothetical protein
MTCAILNLNMIDFCAVAIVCSTDSLSWVSLGLIGLGSTALLIAPYPSDMRQASDLRDSLAKLRDSGESTSAAWVIRCLTVGLILQASQGEGGSTWTDRQVQGANPHDF